MNDPHSDDYDPNGVDELEALRAKIGGRARFASDRKATAEEWEAYRREQERRRKERLGA